MCWKCLGSIEAFSRLCRPCPSPPQAAILDEIVEHRVYEGARLKALFRSYLKLNSGEPFYPTLLEVVEELRAELGVA